MLKPCAWNLTRTEIHYRHDAFSAGLRAAGYDVRKGLPGEIRPGDVVLGWNRYEPNHSLAVRVEKAGGIYVATENGYLGPGGISPHSMNPREWFALARYAHNDSAVISDGGHERWTALGVTLHPWRATGGHVLVAPNRTFGTPGRSMPPEWASDVQRRLKRLTRREIRVRPHPGNEAPKKPLAEDLAGAWAVVIWSSSAGVHALVAGIPVICEAPYWICKEGATYDSLEFVETEKPEYDLDRMTALQRMAWGQFSISEIQSGYAFACLLHPERKAEVAAST